MTRLLPYKGGDFLGPDFLTFIDLCVQVRGIPLPYLSELTVSFIAGTLGPILEMEFNQDTSTYVAFIRVKIRLVFIDRLRFFRRVRFESREDISPASPISQPPLPASLPSHDSYFDAGIQASRLVNPRAISQHHFSSSYSDFKGKEKAKIKIGECSKRKKDKQVDSGT
ncbi:unnamed protein product [Arabidopsis thaliana]|uniref:(thale cress) hypothetical protein n=1 Tax=Arabidopsis thaliana TaxID=3702 RepID=A0A7G2DVK5_ARATH|nr:unnamed protein product [Arabidopsis thaliana]